VSIDRNRISTSPVLQILTIPLNDVLAFVISNLPPGQPSLFAQDPGGGAARPAGNNMETTPGSGRPQNDVGPDAIPEKEKDPAPSASAAGNPKKVEVMPDYSIKGPDVSLVSVDVLVPLPGRSIHPPPEKTTFRVWRTASSQSGG